MQNASKIIQVTPESFYRCNNIWNIDKNKFSPKWLSEIKLGTRFTFAYEHNDEFIGEGSLVLENGDHDYTIPGKRVYFSRFIVKKEYRNLGIGSEIIKFICNKAKEMGYSEISIGVDKDNIVALHLYNNYGFSEVIYEGKDEYGDYYKLLKKLIH